MSKQLKAEELRFKWPEAPASKVQAMYSVIINSKLLHEEMLAKKYITLSVLNSFDDGIVWEDTFGLSTSLSKQVWLLCYARAMHYIIK